MTRPTPARRAVAAAANVRTKFRNEGARGVAQRVVRRVYERVDGASLGFGLLPQDVADSTALELRTPPPVPASRPIEVGWLCTPPMAGSGGHTTMFRMVRALDDAGHHNHVVLYDRHRGDLDPRAAVIHSSWPDARVTVRSIDDGLDGLDVVVATGWETAHVLASRSEAVVQRAYFIQDYEPLFYPHGTEHALATDTYRFGFTNIALGGMVHRWLTMTGVPSTRVAWGRDTHTYSLTNQEHRSGVAFFARPDTPRRGYRLGVLALAEFHRRCPEQEIHVFGADLGDVGFPVTRHGRPTPAQLNELYNRCAAGLALSFTNVSMVPDEMLAAGCIPVVNDSLDVRADFDNVHAEWAAPTPTALALGLERAVARTSPSAVAAAAASVAGTSWERTGRDVVGVIEELARRAGTSPTEEGLAQAFDGRRHEPLGTAAH
ncbi:hypothetical protein SAMN05192575_101416 [Nocardioides alpinus]|uniref:Glycosyl transferase group 1 n=1 Tax=Nocardioides alpinus TaxID=748909 RepID=A0A1I0VRZ0_9ACTN|nr:hypothetical protein [Nocardioides alpinus]PKH37439.1 glycosyl transferase group 1 [Nocardioides alpinus]SFA79094.1 hypothetical protein SAMN05192575_101416 [Nocardioides alpinus]